MKSYALTLQLVDDPAVIAEYERQHQAVWPGVLARIREVGITRMQIFRNATTLFMYIDTTDAFDPARDFLASTKTRSRSAGTSGWRRCSARTRTRRRTSGGTCCRAPSNGVAAAQGP